VGKSRQTESAYVAIFGAKMVRNLRNMKQFSYSIDCGHSICELSDRTILIIIFGTAEIHTYIHIPVALSGA
jgi:hypothetical protein